MLNKLTRNAFRTVAASALLIGMTAQAHATEWVFSLTGSTSQNGSTNVREYTAKDGNQTLKLRVTAWSLTGNASNSVIEDGFLGSYDKGLGVTANTNEAHLIDNSGLKDFVLFQFDRVVQITDATFTGFGNDTDATIGVGNLAWGTSPDLDGEKRSDLNSLLTGGIWASAGTSAGGERNVNLQSKAGNLWMIGAAFNESNDGFKLSQLTVVPVAAVPEPATWGMMIFGFGFVGASMRRRNPKTVAITA